MTCLTQAYLNKSLKKVFYKIGYFVGLNPIPVIVLCILTSFAFVFCGQYFASKNENDLIALYTPANAPSLKEYDVSKAFFKTSGQKFYLRMAVMAREPGASILDAPYPDQILQLHEYLFENFTRTKDKIPFKELCASDCDSNSVMPKIFALRRADKLLTYPIMEAFGISLYMGDHFHGVTVAKDGQALLAAESCSLFFKATYSNDTQKDRLTDWERSVLPLAEGLQYPHSDTLQVYVYSAGLATSEMSKAGMSAAKYFIISFILLLVFTVVSCMKPETQLSKPWEGVAGVINPLLALGAAFGFLFLIGYNFINILVVVPFLVIAIGVDDCFVMVHSWRITSTKLKPEERLALTLSECGPAITLTSLTNTVSFAIGHFSLTQSVSIFCTFSAVGMFVDFIYQITFFAAILALGGRREAKKQNAYLCCLKRNNSGKTAKNIKQHNDATNNYSTYWKIVAMFRKWFSKFGGVYAMFLVTKTARVIAIFLCIPYWTLSIYSATKLKSTLSSEKLFIRDSSIHRFLLWSRSSSWMESMPMYIFVLKNPDLHSGHNLTRMLNMVHDFENTKFSVGDTSTELWLNEYLEFSNFLGTAELSPSAQKYSRLHPVYDNGYLVDFFEMQQQWLDMVHLNRDTEAVEEFVWQTSYKNLLTWGDMNVLHHICRNIAHKYPEFNVSIYQPLNSFYADQVDSIGGVTVKTVSITILCMGVLCLFLIPHLTSVFTSVFCLMSINIGVYGFYQVWYIDLDPISMMTSLFSLGLSIDFVSHISYHYFRPENNNLDCVQKLHESLSAVAWPILQAGISTVISISPLWFNRAYLTDVFAKTVLLVVCLGLAHGLFLLPVFLSCLPKSCCCEEAKAKAKVAPMQSNFEVVEQKTDSCSSSDTT